MVPQHSGSFLTVALSLRMGSSGPLRRLGRGSLSAAKHGRALLALAVIGGAAAVLMAGGGSDAAAEAGPGSETSSAGAASGKASAPDPAAPAGSAAPGKSAQPAPAAGGGPRIVAPRAIEILSGSQPIEVAVPEPEPGTAPQVVEISVDGKVVARLEAPPYRTTFDFGSALGPRTIAAKIASGTGAGRTTEIRTRGFDDRKVDQVARVDLVTLYVSVRDGSGKYVMDLPREEFEVSDSGKPQQLSHFAVERRPVAAAVVIDTSFSMRGEWIEAAREAATRFIRTLAPEDRVLVASFSDEVKVLCELTADRDAAAAAVRTIEARGGTALYDAIYTIADKLAPVDGRKSIVLLSDGRDEAQSGLEPGSLHTFEEALEKALRSEVILFSIGYGKRLETETDFYGRESLRSILDRLATDSGGSAYYPQRASQLKGAYELIGEELRNQYSLAYTPQPLRPDGLWHTIKVTLKSPGLKPVTRKGYYAPRG